MPFKKKKLSIETFMVEFTPVVTANYEFQQVDKSKALAVFGVLGPKEVQCNRTSNASKE